MTLLTADDVLKKTFQTTKFREGYDQDEVDDFLDEIVNTLRVLQTENAELKTKVAELEGGEGVVETTAVVAPVEEEAPEPEVAAVAEVVEEAPAQPQAPAPAYAAPSGTEPESATGMLQLAQRLHDEYVRNGQVEGDRIVGEARAEAEKLVTEAEGQRQRTLKQLESEQATLESKISQLRAFERDYRLRLKGYLGSLVEQLDAQASVVGLDGGTPQL
ncbi:DivIVA domain-containing protein [Salana multivorans]|uniref:Cell wall synthesis protein Wag31 n=1 Tax=Salana multivorans TaxID=120377 RepID=A0A3N2D233_9MICO|nr:DivIVA domain-containing protein [Salana multivorans]MBN8882570.1 DivIVA domain-containing protein [Salana multivorans]OJX95601.1 MAG: cell division protein DivIVA [Micrococcales bacterium 73-15]ROR93835.1 DivIVA domain-containing protein [Salana multivorans]